MSKRKCYLAGGMCKFGKDRFNESNFWRVHIQEVLSEMPVEVCNPNDYFSFKDSHAKYKSTKEVMEFDLNKSAKMDNRINGVKVISANENISEGSEGIILESVLEGMAEYYSADLSEKVILPMTVLKRFDDILAPTLPKKPLLKRLKNFKHKV